jgi:Leucine-rich repeat (LRR) protein
MQICLEIQRIIGQISKCLLNSIKAGISEILNGISLLNSVEKLKFDYIMLENITSIVKLHKLDSIPTEHI